jgi:hypothetical protein
MQQFGISNKEAVKRFNTLRDWLKHETPEQPCCIDLTNFDAWVMIVRAVTKVEAVSLGKETPTITGFIDFSRKHYTPNTR